MQRELVAASIPRPASRPTGRGSHAPRVRFLVKMGSPNRRASCPFTNPLAQGSTDIATNQPSRSSSTTRPPYHYGRLSIEVPHFYFIRLRRLRSYVSSSSCPGSSSSVLCSLCLLVLVRRLLSSFLVLLFCFLFDFHEKVAF